MCLYISICWVILKNIDREVFESFERGLAYYRLKSLEVQLSLNLVAEIQIQLSPVIGQVNRAKTPSRTRSSHTLLFPG